jgi:hypothetical protein
MQEFATGKLHSVIPRRAWVLLRELMVDFGSLAPEAPPLPSKSRGNPHIPLATLSIKYPSGLMLGCDLMSLFGTPVSTRS